MKRCPDCGIELVALDHAALAEHRAACEARQMLAAGAPIERVALHAQGLLSEEFKIVGAAGWPDAFRPASLQQARAFVLEHGGRLYRRHVGEWWEDSGQ